MRDSQLPDIEQLLTAVGEHLEAQDASVGIVVLGGAALNLLGIVSRATRDVDVVAISEDNGGSGPRVIGPPEPMPHSLEGAIRTVARDFGLPEDWMNTKAGLQWRTDLPPGLDQRLRWRRYGGLHVGIVSRYDLVFKLYAAADSGGPSSVHYQDLLALTPREGELQEATHWVREQDPSPGFASILDSVLETLSDDLR